MAIPALSIYGLRSMSAMAVASRRPHDRVRHVIADWGTVIIFDRKKLLWDVENLRIRTPGTQNSSCCSACSLFHPPSLHNIAQLAILTIDRSKGLTHSCHILPLIYHQVWNKSDIPICRYSILRAVHDTLVEINSVIRKNVQHELQISSRRIRRRPRLKYVRKLIYVSAFMSSGRRSPRCTYTEWQKQ